MNVNRIEDAVLLNRYYDKRALSSIADAPTFKFGKVQWASDLIEMVDGKPVVANIDKTLSSLNGVFKTNDAVFTYLNGVIHVKASLPPNALEEGQKEQFSALGFLDNEDELIAVVACLPVWVYSDRGLDLTIQIKTNIS
ncbi:hypothetical protein I3271_05270 [Photobacterium leiognathi]|uniref:hypothetical protein n=1 Tax=Photobacterium leiognathi TaxID=553611 RepID=UPI001EDE739C|nr:hypothetical protein [Photobacterium leiognathi]MCG3884090.1 hypothetical protein [Photobacterium leiognathi]